MSFCLSGLMLNKPNCAFQQKESKLMCKMCFQIDYVNFNFLNMFSSQEAVKTPTTKAMALRATTKKRLAPKSERPWSTTCSTRTQIFRLTRKCELIHSPPGEKLSYNLKFFSLFFVIKKNSNSLVKLSLGFTELILVQTLAE